MTDKRDLVERVARAMDPCDFYFWDNKEDHCVTCSAEKADLREKARVAITETLEAMMEWLEAEQEGSKYPFLVGIDDIREWAAAHNLTLKKDSDG